MPEINTSKLQIIEDYKQALIQATEAELRYRGVVESERTAVMHELNTKLNEVLTEIVDGEPVKDEIKRITGEFKKALKEALPRATQKKDMLGRIKAIDSKSLFSVTPEEAGDKSDRQIKRMHSTRFETRIMNAAKKSLAPHRKLEASLLKDMGIEPTRTIESGGVNQRQKQPVSFHNKVANILNKSTDDTSSLWQTYAKLKSLQKPKASSLKKITLLEFSIQRTINVLDEESRKKFLDKHATHPGFQTFLNAHLADQTPEFQTAALEQQPKLFWAAYAANKDNQNELTTLANTAISLIDQANKEEANNASVNSLVEDGIADGKKGFQQFLNAHLHELPDSFKKIILEMSPKHFWTAYGKATPEMQGQLDNFITKSLAEKPELFTSATAPAILAALEKNKKKNPALFDKVNTTMTQAAQALMVSGEAPQATQDQLNAIKQKISEAKHNLVHSMSAETEVKDKASLLTEYHTGLNQALEQMTKLLTEVDGIPPSNKAAALSLLQSDLYQLIGENRMYFSSPEEMYRDYILNMQETFDLGIKGILETNGLTLNELRNLPFDTSKERAASIALMQPILGDESLGNFDTFAKFKEKAGITDAHTIEAHENAMMSCYNAALKALGKRPIEAAEDIDLQQLKTDFATTISSSSAAIFNQLKANITKLEEALSHCDKATTPKDYYQALAESLQKNIDKLVRDHMKELTNEEKLNLLERLNKEPYLSALKGKFWEDSRIVCRFSANASEKLLTELTSAENAEFF